MYEYLKSRGNLRVIIVNIFFKGRKIILFSQPFWAVSLTLPLLKRDLCPADSDWLNYECDGLLCDCVTDPEKWERRDVLRWVRWAARTFGVRAPRRRLLPGAGPALLQLTADDWLQVPRSPYNNSQLSKKGEGSQHENAIRTYCFPIYFIHSAEWR